MDGSILLRHLADAERHIARGVVHLARQEALIAQLEQDGQDSQTARAILATLRETQVLHLRERERLLEKTQTWISSQENRATMDRSRIYRLTDIREEDAQRVAHLREMESRAVELLKQSAPDTFLGRQRHDFIPLRHELA